MKMAENLLKAANSLLADAATKTMGRRAISTAYYAVFHTLTQMCTEELLGDEADTNSPEYARVYRALDHGSMKAAFRAVPLKGLPQIQTIGNRAVELQSERIRADYLPHKSKMYTRRQCSDLLQSARLTIEAVEKLAPAERRVLAVHLIFKNRPQ